MQKTFIAVVLMACGLSSVNQCLGQTPLAKAFADMHSNDQDVVYKARLSVPALLDKEMATIEKDTSLLCLSLSDPDEKIRMMAAAVLQTIVVAAPQHNQVVLSCFPQLLVTATDADDYVRNDSLRTLALNPAGPPPQAHDIFVKSLSSPNFRTEQLGAAGLLKETGPNKEPNHELVRKALDDAPDAQHRLNMLYAIGGAEVPSDTLFQAVQKYLYDSDPEIQTAAIEAVGATATDKARAKIVIQNLLGSPTLKWEQRMHAKGVLNSLNRSQ